MNAEPSSWVLRALPLLRPGGVVLDVAAGAGRHSRALRAAGFDVVAVDVDTTHLDDLRADPAVEVVTADLESESWPFGDRRFDGIVVTNYLHRPLFDVLLGSLVAGGVLVYETYARGQERFGRPREPDFLLRAGELLEVVRGRASVVAFEDLVLPRPARVQRIIAVNGTPRDRPSGG